MNPAYSVPPLDGPRNATEPSRHGTVPPSASSSSESFPILLVEDSDDDLFLFRRLLTKASVANPLSIALDGQAAIDELAHKLVGSASPSLPRIVFLDLKLPLKSGFEVLEWTRAQAAYKNTAVIILSSSAELRDIRRAYELGASGYLVKYPAPAVFQEIVGMIKALPSDQSPVGLVFPGMAKP